MNMTFIKALTQLDKENYEKGEALLKQAITECELANQEYELMSIYCCYGELLCTLSREQEAIPYLQKIVDYYAENYEPEHEYQPATQLLAKLHP